MKYYAVAAMDNLTLLTWQLDDDTDIALVEAQGLLSEDEADRAARFHFRRDRERFARARGFLRRSLAALVAGSPRDIRFHYADGGKPSIPNGPAFNLSHSEGMAAVAIAPGGAVGVDIEVTAQRTGLLRDLDRLAAACFRPEERSAIDAAPDKLARFLQFWTAKEARMKLTGEGLGLEPIRIALELDDRGEAKGISYPDSPLSRLSRFEGPGFVGAIAVSTEET